MPMTVAPRIPQPSELGESQKKAAGAPASDSEGTESFQVVEKSSLNGGETCDRPTKRAEVAVGQQIPSSMELTMQSMEDETNAIRHQMGVLRAENIHLDNTSNQLQSENDDLNSELSRLRMALARERADKTQARKKYTELLKECSLTPDDLTKEIHKHRARADDLEHRLNTETVSQKKFWQDLNKQLAKENDEHVATLSKLSIKLEESNSDQIRAKNENKAGVLALETKLEDAFKEAQDARNQLERVQLENAKLRQEKAQQKVKLEDKISQMSKNASSRTLPALGEDDDDEDLSTDKLLEMMSSQLGMDVNY